MATIKKKYETEMADIPNRISESEVLTYIQTKKIGWKDIALFKEWTALTDDIISSWFDISVKTFRSYKKPNASFNVNFKEKLLLLLSLFKQGEKVFGTNEVFNEWLNKENFHFDNTPPMRFLNTISGIRYVENRLIAMEYGDNV